METTKIPKRAEDYLDEKFPKGDKRRGEAMVLLALALVEEEKKPEPLTNWEISVLRSSLIKNEEIHDKNVEIIIKKLGKLEAQK